MSYFTFAQTLLSNFSTISQLPLNSFTIRAVILFNTKILNRFCIQKNGMGYQK